MGAMAIHKRGSGTVFQRGSTWWIQYYVRSSRVRESTGFTEKKDAENLLRQRLGDVAAGRHVGPEKATVGDLCDLVIADYQFRGFRSTKVVAWRYAANVKPILGSLPAARFGPQHVRLYVEKRRQAGASNASINRELAIVRRGFHLGALEDPPLVHHQPAIPGLEEDNARQGFIEREQYETLLWQLPENLRALFVCGYHTGARKNELRRIKWDQVDFDARVIRLEACQTKGKRARTLPIYGDMELWLRKQQDAAPSGNPYAFHGQHRCPVDNHMLGWAEACARAGFPGLLFHDMRRSAVRNMKRAGIQDVVAMAISGHKTRSIFDRYNIVDEADVSGAAEKLEQYFERRQQDQAAKLKRVK